MPSECLQCAATAPTTPLPTTTTTRAPTLPPNVFYRCAREIDSPAQGVILSHRLYDGNSTYDRKSFCDWRLKAPRGWIVELLVERLDLEVGALGCKVVQCLWKVLVCR